MSLGENIKRARKEKGLTQKDLANKLETTPQNLAQYESGKRNPKYETLEKIANALEVPALDLMHGPGTHKRIFDKIDPSIESEIQNHAALFYSTVKALESIYGRAVVMDVNIYRDGLLSSSSDYISVGEEDKEIAISNTDFDSILNLVKDVLKNSVSMLGEKKSVFLQEWKKELETEDIRVEPSEFVKLAILDKNGERHSPLE